MNTNWLCPRAGVCVLAGLVSVAGAQPQTAQLRAIVLEDESTWRFAPVVDGLNELGVIAHRQAGAIHSSDFAVVWFERVDDGYKVYGCRTSHVRDACGAIAERTGFSDAGWQLTADEEGSSSSGCDDMLRFSRLFVELQSGISVEDPLASYALNLTGEGVELMVQMGAAGAHQLSGQLAGTASHQPRPLFEQLDELLVYASAFSDSAGADLPPDGSWCIPRWVSYKLAETSVWDPPFQCADGKCRYTGTRTVKTRTCKLQFDCTLQNCTDTVTTTSVEKLCLPVNGECPSTPPC